MQLVTKVTVLIIVFQSGESFRPISPSSPRIHPSVCTTTRATLLQMTRDQQQKGKQYNERDQLLPNIPETTINPQQTLSVGNQILSLAIPAASALLIDPLMTLADTAMVGRYSSGPEALAGMGSASALLTFSFYLFNFLCTATTPLVAQRRAANQLEQAQAVGGQAITLAWVLGACLIAILLTFRQPLLYIMGTGITGDLANGYALAFLSVRALAAPAVLSMEASTGVLRGYLDTKTPIAVLVAANLINLLLDVVLIVIMKMGPMGAAIATTTAEWISAGLFLAVLSGKLPSQGVEKRLAVVPLLSIPSWDDVKPLVVASGSVLLRTLVLQLSLSAAAAMAARGESAAAASIAAHQIGIQLWLMCSFFCDSLAAASQGLVADAIGRKDSRAVLDVSKTVFAYSVILGLSLAGLLWTGEASGMLAAFFTKDGDIRVALDEILPLIILAQPLNALVFSADGILQGASEFPYQAKAMLVSGLTAVSTFVCLEAFYEDSDRLIHVWAALIALQAMRGFSSLWKLVDVKGPINLLNRKTV